MNARGPRDLAGIGMTSQRTRLRMVERLREKGIRNERVLAAMGAVPRCRSWAVPATCGTTLLRSGYATPW